MSKSYDIRITGRTETGALMAMDGTDVRVVYWDDKRFSSIEAYLAHFAQSGAWSNIEVEVDGSYVGGQEFASNLVRSAPKSAPLTLDVVGCNVGTVAGGIFEFHNRNFEPLTKQAKALMASGITFEQLYGPAIREIFCPWLKSNGIAAPQDALNDTLARTVSYIRSAELGKKRFVSLPARKTPGRLTHIGTGEVLADSAVAFVTQWTAHAPLLTECKTIPDKYRDVTDDERAHSKFWQLLWLCLFDLVMWSVFDATPDSDRIRGEAVAHAKQQQGGTGQMGMMVARAPTVALVSEVDTRNEEALSAIWAGYDLVLPKERGEQTQVVALKTGFFTNVRTLLDDGKLLAVSVETIAKPGRFVFASFHGVSEGTDTVAAVEELKQAMQSEAGFSLVACFDANTSLYPDNALKLNMRQFQDAVSGLQCMPTPGDADSFTTFGGRTLMQAQPHKSCDVPVRDQRDFVLISPDIEVASFEIGRGSGGPMPNAGHAADHAELRVQLRI